MLDPYSIDPALNAFILNQRKINSLFRKEMGINRTHIEILAFANTAISFNPYQVQRQFGEMNLQQVRLGIRKLNSIGAIELWLAGARNKPAVYMITKRGRELLKTYNQSWLDRMYREIVGIT